MTSAIAAATATSAALRPFHPAVARACRYPAYSTQVMNDQVSLGSQPQYRPHAASAQIAPAMIAKVQTGKAKAITTYAARSSAPAAGSDRPSDTGNRTA